MKMRKRRGIGTVLASAVMVFLMVLTISQLYINGINQLDNYNSVAQQVFNTNAAKQSERLSIVSAQLTTTTPPNMIVSLTIQNTGGVSSHLVSVWINNVDQSTSPHKMIPISVFVGAGLSTILSNLDTGVPYNALNKLVVKAFTELGNSVSIELLPPGLAGTSPGLLATVSVTLVPPNPITTNDIVIVLTVTNNNNLGVAFTGLVPSIYTCQGIPPSSPTPTGPNSCIGSTNTCSSVSSPVTCTAVSGPTPPSVPFLPYGTTAVIQWIYLVTTIAADTPIWIQASYTPVTTANLDASQVALGTAVIRAPGGATQSSGGSLASVLGNIVNYFTTFQYSQDGVNWQSAFQVDTSKSKLWFRVNVTNLSSQTIAFNSTTEIVLNLLRGNGATTDFYVTAACPVASTTGAVSSASSTGLTASASPGWATNQWLNYLVQIYSGNKVGSFGVITGNGADTLTISSAWSNGNPDSSSSFVIGPAVSTTGSASGGSSTTLTVSGSPWTTNQWAGYFVMIYSNPGKGTQGTIISNTANSLTVSSPGWSGGNPGSGSGFVIVPSPRQPFFAKKTACPTNNIFPYASGYNSGTKLDTRPDLRSMVGPGQTVTLYFSASSPGTFTQIATPSAGLYQGIFTIVATTYQGLYVALGNTPLNRYPSSGNLVLIPAEINPPYSGNCAVIGMPAGNCYPVVVQTGWSTAVSLAAGSNLNGFALTFATPSPTCSQPPSSACSYTQTFTWGVMNPSVPYAQSSPFFTVNIA